jgi:hypothetical protein
MQRIADAGTLVKKRSVELGVMRGRMGSEMIVKESVDDEYGKDRINAMIADINAEYAAMGVNVGITHDTGVVGTEGDDDEEEGNDSGHEIPLSERYVYLSRYAAYMRDNMHMLVLFSCHIFILFIFLYSDAESALALLSNSK